MRRGKGKSWSGEERVWKWGSQNFKNTQAHICNGAWNDVMGV